jgi:hypothetical protein
MLQGYIMKTGSMNPHPGQELPSRHTRASVRMYLSGRTRTTLNSLPEKGVSGTGGH